MNNSETNPQSFPANLKAGLTDMMKNQASLTDQIQKALACIGYSQLNSVRCISNGDEVTLSGQLDSFYLKQVAQSVAVKVPGVKVVKNEILVK